MYFRNASIATDAETVSCMRLAANFVCMANIPAYVENVNWPLCGTFGAGASQKHPMAATEHLTVNGMLKSFGVDCEQPNSNILATLG